MTAQPKARNHRKLVVALIAIASLLAFLATFAVWANRQLLETDTWTNTSTKLLEDPAIRTQLSNYMVDTLYTNVDVQAELQQGLPPRLQPLAGPAAGALRQLANTAANRLLQNPKVEELWKDANRKAQETLLSVVENGDSQSVTLDLGTLIDQLGQQAGVNAAGKLPPQAAQIQIVSNDDLVKVNDLLNLLKTIAWVLTILALGLFALAVYLATDWRREALRSVGFAFIGIGIAVLLVRSLLGDVVVNALSSTEAVEPAASDTWSIGTSLLADQGGAMVFYGLFIVLGAWLAGPRGFARDARRTITPLLQRRLLAYPALLLVLLVLFWWSPTPGFQRLPTALLLIALFVVGLEFLRHQAIRDFPGETWESASERWREARRSLLGRRGDGHPPSDS